MAEGLAGRVGRIISGGVNAIVDAMEDAAPEMVMEQAIRDIDTAVDEVRSELGKEIAAKHLANKRLTEKNTRHEGLAEQIELAIEEGRDDLAEVAIANQLDIEAQMPVLEQTITECGEREKELEGYITALQAKKREMRDELANYRESIKSAASESKSNSAAVVKKSAVDQKVDQATTAFDRILEKQTGVGSTNTTQNDAVKLAELEQLARDNRVKERLAKIKSAKVGD